jgi:hypothetical protein
MSLIEIFKRVAHKQFHSIGNGLLPQKKMNTPGVEGEGMEWIILAQDRE